MQLPLVYVVEDHPAQGQAIVDWLAPTHRVRLFPSAEDLLSVLDASDVPDLFLLDVFMPGMDGLTLCQHLKGLPSFSHVPAVLLTADDDSNTELRALEAGADDFITRPVRREVLLARLALHLRTRRAQAQLQRDNLQLGERVRASDRELLRANRNLEKLVAIGLEFGAERERMALLQSILQAGQELSNCQAATLFLITDHKTLRFELRTQSDPLPVTELPLYDPVSGEPIHRFVATHVALSGETVVIDDVYTETRFDLSGTKRFSDESGMKAISMMTVPMALRDGEVVGVLQFVNATDPETGQVTTFARDLVRTLKAMGAQAAVALENLRLIESQKDLMDSLIRLIAGAIDAKSPYTGGHNERVPELAFMLAHEASQVKEGPLAGFGFASEEEWREFRIGAWLHDCGKVTSPEYVVDKATKLETIYNRIHEIRTRFEVLLRDARIEALEAELEGQPRAQAQADYERRRADLLDDFVFVAECNLGSEFMAPERVERLRQIAARTWWRHFDDRLGLAEAELKRYPEEVPELPVREALLVDRPEHQVPRSPDEGHLDEKFGFKLKVPELLYNRGEVYNLSIGRGTLTEEERFKVNEHIIQTIVMLEKLPLPRNLRRVPEYAGTHHETLAGTGYPRRLSASELSIPSRIMAIADIFEALTAPDRPYKKTKTLSECVRILWFFKKDRHIDPVLFDLFLTSGIYKAYAQRFLLPEQIDEVDIGAYLGPVGAPG
jgi:response regulator RpfG family c-di-GMP phosphodiesterase